MKQAFIFLIAVVLATPSVWAGGPSSLPPRKDKPTETRPLFDDFEGETLDARKWLIARTQWGGKNANGGVVPDNIHLKPGRLIIEGLGDKYIGPVRGVRRIGGKISPIGDGRRTGACLVTRDCYASGRYEVRMKVPQNLGVCTALWTFNYNEVDKDHEEYIANKGQGPIYISNHEIDIELPGRPNSTIANIGYDWVLLNTWVGERDRDMTFGPTRLPFKVNDGEFHTWRFDWHTGDPEGKTGKVIEPRVDFYLDGQLLRTTKTTIPIDAGHFWIGLWFPKNWAGTPDFNVETLEVDWVRITPFQEPGDRHKYSRPGPDRFLLGPQQWPKQLRANDKGASNEPDARDGRP